MTKSVWGEARTQAAKDTLELVRLNEPSRALLTLGVPVAIVGGAWLISHELALTAIIGVVALALLALVVFLAKMIANVARFAEQARTDLAGQEAQADEAGRNRRHAIVGRLADLYCLEMGDRAAPAIRAGLALPPEDWLNEHLQELGEVWSIFNIQGRSYQTFEILAGEWRYRGQRMRSPAAIKWAAFFDALDLQWQLGSESWDRANAVAPDFFLPQLNAWFVAEYAIDEAKMERHCETARQTGRRVIIGDGQPAPDKESIYLVEPDGTLDGGGWTWGEDRRDRGVYWLTKLDWMGAKLLGGPGTPTDHDRGPIIGDLIKGAFEAAQRQPAEFERPPIGRRGR